MKWIAWLSKSKAWEGRRIIGKHKRSFSEPAELRKNYRISGQETFRYKGRNQFYSSGIDKHTFIMNNRH